MFVGLMGKRSLGGMALHGSVYTSNTCFFFLDMSNRCQLILTKTMVLFSTARFYAAYVYTWCNVDYINLQVLSQEQSQKPVQQWTNLQIWTNKQVQHWKDCIRTVFMQKWWNEPEVYKSEIKFFLTADLQEEWDRLQYYWWHFPMLYYRLH